MRQIILDTETTGLNPKNGDRIIEVGCIEIVNRRLTGQSFHRYVNPGRDSDPGALAIHGLTSDFLSDKPAFADIADALCAFIDGAEVLMHNAAFDVAFLDEEYARLDRAGLIAHCGSINDTLAMARDLHPGKRNSLDALCERYGVSNAHRTLHGALLDAELLAEVYLAMTRGQESFLIDIDPQHHEHALARVDRLQLRVVYADPAELASHRSVLESIAHECKAPLVWAGALTPVSGYLATAME